MGKTPIEWADHSINPLRARNLETGKVGHFCAKVSQGCKNCYSSKLQKPHLVGLPFLAENRPKVELFFEEKAIQEVLRRRQPTTYFWCDMTDMFWEEYPDEWIDRCFAAMALTPWHTHLVLTKRAERLPEYIGAKLGAGHRGDRINSLMADGSFFRHFPAGRLFPRYQVWPLPNVWLGVSVEDQATADERIPLLLQTPAAIRFVSYEPALGPVDFRKFFDEGLECNYCGQWRGTEETAKPDGNDDDPGFLCTKCGEACAHLPLDERLDWIIVGGESGPGARPFDIAWARSVVEQCRAAAVAVFVKQLGALPIVDSDGKLIQDVARVFNVPPRRIAGMCLNDKKGGNWDEWPSDLRVREYPETGAASKVKPSRDANASGSEVR